MFRINKKWTAEVECENLTNWEDSKVLADGLRSKGIIAKPRIIRIDQDRHEYYNGLEVVTEYLEKPVFGFRLIGITSVFTKDSEIKQKIQQGFDGNDFWISFYLSGVQIKTKRGIV